MGQTGESEVVRRLCLVGVGVGVCVLALVGCSSPKPPAQRPSAPAASAPSTPSPSPAAPSVAAGNLAWTFHAAGILWIAATPDGYILAGRHDVLSLDNGGRQRWQQSFADQDSLNVEVAGSTVLVSWKNPQREQWPGSLLVKAFDATSGAVLWSDDQPSFVSAHASAVYTSVCHGGQNNRIGDCHLAARDPRTGKARWTVATYASSRVDVDLDGIAAPPAPPYLVIEAYPTGYASKTFTTVDPASGRTLGTSVKATWADQTTDVLLQWADDANRPETGCTTTVAAWKPRSTAAAWRKSFTNATRTDGQCRGPRYDVADGALAVADSSGRTSLLDLGTGATAWTAGEPGPPLLVSADVLVIANAGGGVTAYDRTTGRPRWRTDGPARGDVLDSGLAARVLDGWLVVYDREASTYCSPACSTVSVLEPSTGSLFRAPPGRLITTANGTVVTQTEGLRQPSGTADYFAYTIRSSSVRPGPTATAFTKHPHPGA